MFNVRGKIFYEREKSFTLPWNEMPKPTFQKQASSAEPRILSGAIWKMKSVVQWSLGNACSTKLCG